jgi:hypothetical protein
VLAADIALPDFWQNVRDGGEIAVDMQHDQAVVNSGSAYQQVDGTGAAVLPLLLYRVATLLYRVATLLYRVATGTAPVR